jgi:DNA-binding MurR/RpiR family transcriptional regulator
MANRKTDSEVSNVVQVIRERYDSLNNTYKKIADYILQNLEKATFSSLMEISKDIGTSDASIIRFAKEIGYKGYQDLRQSLIWYIRRIIYPSQKLSFHFNENGQSHPLIETVMEKDVDYIIKTISKIDTDDFDTLVQFICSAKRIFCMGWGMSSFLAEYLAFNLRFLSYQAIDVTRERRPLIQQILPMDKNDILITFDLMMYSVEIIEAIEYIHKKNSDIKIITITNDPKAQIVQYSHLCFFIDILGQQFRLISLTAPFCFINAIIEQVYDNDSEKAKKALNEIQKVIFSSPLHYSQLKF